MYKRQAPIRTDHRVALIPCALGSGPELIRHAASSGSYAGIIVAAYGAGHVSQAEAEEIGRHTGKLPIIIASRTGCGKTACTTYGYPGSEMDLVARGAWLAGWLSPVKARILLWGLIAARPQAEWKQVFEAWANGF